MFKVKQKWQLPKEYCVARSTMIGMASGQPSSARTFLGGSEKDIIPLKCEALCADSGTPRNAFYLPVNMTVSPALEGGMLGLL